MIFIETATGGVAARISTARRLATSTVQNSIGGPTSIDDKTLTDAVDLIEALILAALRTLIAVRASTAISAGSLISIATETTAGPMPAVTKIAAHHSIASRAFAATAMTTATAIVGTFNVEEAITATTVTSVAEAIMTARGMIGEDRAVRVIRATLTATTDHRGGKLPPFSFVDESLNSHLTISSACCGSAIIAFVVADFCDCLSGGLDQI